MSAPHSIGRIRYGVERVLSTISGTPASWATRGDALDVQHVLARVGDHLAEEQLGVGPDGVAPLLQVVRILHERHGDAELLQGVGQQVVGAAVEAGAGHHVVAGFGDVEDGEGLRGLAGAEQQRRRGRLPGWPRAVPRRPGWGCRSGCRSAQARPARSGWRRSRRWGTRTTSSGRWAGHGRRWRCPAPGRRGSGGFRRTRRWTSGSSSGTGHRPARRPSARGGAGAALAARRAPDGQVFTRGTPPRNEGCRPASRGCALALMTWLQCRNGARAREQLCDEDEVAHRAGRAAGPASTGPGVAQATSHRQLGLP